MKKLNVAVVGAGGRVGNELGRLMKASSNFSASLGIGRNVPADYLQNSENVPQKISGVDVMIDFSSPELFESAIQEAVRSKIPFVSGTTGLSENQIKQLEIAAQTIPVLWASNMSIGVAVLGESLKALKGLEGFDFFIEEFHHNKKKDNPSGTAITLWEKMKKLGINVAKPIGFRGGGIYGVHKIHAVSNEEHLVLEHQALNRAVFAKGALKAAEWLVGKPAGKYQVENIFA